MAVSRAYHGRVRKASTRTSKATKKAKDVRRGRRARVHGANVRKGF